jgi:hypothetical protein
VARGGAERDHRGAAHDAGLRARAPPGLALEAEHVVVLLGHTLGNVIRELQEPVVELAEVAEDERLYVPVLVEEVALAPPDIGLCVRLLVFAARVPQPQPESEHLCVLEQNFSLFVSACT